MKNLKLIAAGILFSLFIISCHNSADDKKKGDSLYQDSIKQVTALANKKRTDSLYRDSVQKTSVLGNKSNKNSEIESNYIDEAGKRQGLWILYGRDKNDPAFPKNSKWKEGRYVNGEKDGEWKEYEANGKVKKKINYKAGVIVK